MQAFKEALHTLLQEQIQDIIDHSKDHLNDYGNLDSFNPEFTLEQFDNVLEHDFGDAYHNGGNEALINQLEDTDYVEQLIENQKKAIKEVIQDELEDLTPNTFLLDEYLKYGEVMGNFNFDETLEELTQDIYKLKKAIKEL